MDFDPFLALPLAQTTKTWSSRTFLLFLPAVVVVLLCVTHIEHTLGSPKDFSPIKDARSAVGLPETTRPPADFPLFRDFSNAWLIVVICLTLPLVHLQWVRMSRVVTSLTTTGALVVKPTADFKFKHRLLLLERAVNKTAGVDPLERLVGASCRYLTRLGKFTIVLALLAAALSVLVVIGPNHNGLFGSFAAGVPKAQRHQWLQAAYHSWWASIDRTGGFLLYTSLLTFGCFLILIQNLVGLLAVWFLQGLSAVCDFRLDWRNLDGNYGWSAVTATYRTVILSLVLHGSALSVALLAFGLNNLAYSSAIMAVWFVMLPSVTAGPFSTFYGLSKRAQEERLGALAAAFPSPLTLLQEDELRQRAKEVRASKAAPLMLRRGALPAFFVAVLFPLILTAAQIYFPIRFGSGGSTTSSH